MHCDARGRRGFSNILARARLLFYFTSDFTENMGGNIPFYPLCFVDHPLEFQVLPCFSFASAKDVELSLVQQLRQVTVILQIYS